MEHYYVITGNEYGASLNTKRNFKITEYDAASKYFKAVQDDDCFVCMMYVDANGNEYCKLHINNEEQ